MIWKDSRVKNWIRETNARWLCFPGGISFAVPEKYNQPCLTSLLQNFDESLEKSRLLKQSKTTTAGLVSGYSGSESLFLKRTNNKGLKFTLRYLFRPARAFRATLAAAALEKCGIPTPSVLAVGEKRSGLLLHAGYIVTDSQPGITGVDSLFGAMEKPMDFLFSFLPEAASAMAVLHKANVVHGDLKLSNFYSTGGMSGPFGIWDLDSVRFYASIPPREKIERELGRLIASCLSSLPTENTDCDLLLSQLTDFLISAYSRISGIPLVPEREGVTAWARFHYLHMVRRAGKAGVQ